MRVPQGGDLLRERAWSRVPEGPRVKLALLAHYLCGLGSRECLELQLLTYVMG